MAGSTLLATAAQLSGQAQQAEIGQNQANYMAQVARNNQQVGEWNAQRALQQGQVDEDQQRQKTAQQIGSQRALLASQGADIDSGSAVDLVGDTARSGEFNAQTIRNTAQMNAWNNRLQGNLYGGQAGLYGSQAANAWLPFNNSLLGAASSLAQRWAPLLTGT
jgi:hypothetical protein